MAYHLNIDSLSQYPVGTLGPWEVKLESSGVSEHKNLPVSGSYSQVRVFLSHLHQMHLLGLADSSPPSFYIRNPSWLLGVLLVLGSKYHMADFIFFQSRSSRQLLVWRSAWWHHPDGHRRALWQHARLHDPSGTEKTEGITPGYQLILCMS